MSEIANIIFKETKYTLKDAKARADVVTAKSTADAASTKSAKAEVTANAASAKADANKKEIDTLKEKTLDLSYQEETESLTFS